MKAHKRTNMLYDPSHYVLLLKEGLGGLAFVGACARPKTRNGAWISLNI